MAVGRSLTHHLASLSPELPPPYTHINFQPLGTPGFHDQTFYELDVTQHDELHLPCIQVSARVLPYPDRTYHQLPQPTLF